MPRELDASVVVGALSNLDPIVGVLTAVLFLGEVLSGWQIVSAWRDGGDVVGHRR